MSTSRGIVQPAHPIGRQVWVAAIVALVLVAAIAIWATGFERSAIEVVPAPVQRIDAPGVPVEGAGPHGPHQTPKQMPSRGNFRPHGPNQMPKS